MRKNMLFHIDITDILELLPLFRAAVPYILPPYCTGFSAVIKVLDAYDSIRCLKHMSKTDKCKTCRHDCHRGPYVKDMEEMLSAISEYCPSKYLQYINTICNALKAMKYYDTYKDIFAMMADADNDSNCNYTGSDPCPDSCDAPGDDPCPDSCDAPDDDPCPDSCDAPGDDPCPDSCDAPGSKNTSGKGINNSMFDSLGDILGPENKSKLDIMKNLFAMQNK